MTDAVVWKYEVPINGETTLRVPGGATPLSVVMGVPSSRTPGVIWLYFLVDPQGVYKDVPVYVRGTGLPVPPTVQESRFVGTVLDVDPNYPRPLVWHVWFGGSND